MSYAYMKALESSPERYDKGIKILGWGQLGKIREKIQLLAKDKGKSVLELGIGTGEQAVMLAEDGHDVTGIDSSRRMLTQSQKKLDSVSSLEGGFADIASKIKLIHKCAVQVDEFDDETFDIVTMTLLFSELHLSEQLYILKHSYRVLKPGGCLILADEVVPDTFLRRLLYKCVSTPMKLITYIISQNSTSGVKNMTKKVQEAGLEVNSVTDFQFGFFKVVEASKAGNENQIDHERYEEHFKPIPRPRGWLFMLLWETTFRMLGHPTEIGLIKIGKASKDSPILCTCNFKLTVVRLSKLLENSGINCWLLVAPTNGINVWCASCGDNFNAGSVITAIRVSNLQKYADGKTIVMPQLSAPGVSVRDVKKATGYKIVWGPTHMDQLPSFMRTYPDSIRNKTEEHRKVRFGMAERIEMACSIGLLMLLIFGVSLALLNSVFLQFQNSLGILVSLTLILFVPYIIWPLIPFETGKKKIFSTFVMLLFFVLIPTGMWVFLPLQLLVLYLSMMDADGMTPIRRSSYISNSFNKGKVKVTERWGESFDVTIYGKIKVDLEKCIGCGTCVDVCPMLIPALNSLEKKVVLVNSDSCVNCRACVNQCPKNALYFELETEKAKKALSALLKKNGMASFGYVANGGDDANIEENVQVAVNVENIVKEEDIHEVSIDVEEEKLIKK